VHGNDVPSLIGAKTLKTGKFTATVLPDIGSTRTIPPVRAAAHSIACRYRDSLGRFEQSIY
jgi:hypothetical protein